MIEPDSAQVEVYSGHAYAQEPRAFVWLGVRYVVARIEDRWRTPEGPAFRLRAESSVPPFHLCAGPARRFDLTYHEIEDRWVVHSLET